MDASLSTDGSDTNAEQHADAPALEALTPYDLETVTIMRREYVQLKNHA